MRHPRGVLGFALASALAVACSTTPHFVPDATGAAAGSGGTGGETASTGGAGGAAAAPCLHVGDCNLVDSDCAHPACQAGACVLVPAPAGTPTAAQLPRDCQQRVCDGAGRVVSKPDDTDLPDDGNPCTEDTCTGGVPAHAMATVGTPCGTGGGGPGNGKAACDGMGTCAGCFADAQCGAAGPCFTWVCSPNQVCQQTFLPAGTGDPGGGAPGDCQRNVCDGMGFGITLPDPADVPSAPNTCTMGACAGGVPALAPAAAGTACLAGACDGTGHCGTCTTDGECGPPTVCATPVCFAGHCSANYVAAGTPGPQQVAGDCSASVCDATGHLATMPDPADLPPASADPCFTDGCDPDGNVTHLPVTNSTPCGGCSTCQAGVCTDPCPAMGCQCLDGLCQGCGFGG